MKRQGLIVTAQELRDLAYHLEHQNMFSNKKTKFQINIINKTPKCSDTWEIEDANCVEDEHGN